MTYLRDALLWTTLGLIVAYPAARGARAWVVRRSTWWR